MFIKVSHIQHLVMNYTNLRVMSLAFWENQSTSIDFFYALIRGFYCNFIKGEQTENIDH
jgi:hypothetical protein